MVLKPDDFTEQAQEIIGKSQEIVRRYQHSQWDVEHILMALLEQVYGPDTWWTGVRRHGGHI